MANWEKLNKEFDDALNSMTKEDWDNWYKNVEQKRINQNKMGLIKDLTNQMKNDPWHVKLRRWLRIQRWVWMCRTRFIWDLDYEHNIFRKFK